MIPDALPCTTEVKCTMLGAVLSVTGAARSHAEWAWLTGRRVAQVGYTPLYYSATYGHEAAIKALVAAKADVHATDKVRGV